MLYNIDGEPRKTNNAFIEVDSAMCCNLECKEVEKLFKNGNTHIKFVCKECNKFKGWKQQPIEEFIVNFGKYKGEKISDIPNDYLVWLITMEWLKPKLKERIKKYLDKVLS